MRREPGDRAVRRSVVDDDDVHAFGDVPENNPRRGINLERVGQFNRHGDVIRRHEALAL